MTIKLIAGTFIVSVVLAALGYGGYELVSSNQMRDTPIVPFLDAERLFGGDNLNGESVPQRAPDLIK